MAQRLRSLAARLRGPFVWRHWAWRHWLVALVVLAGAVSTALAAVTLARAPGVYWSEAQISILIPQSAENPNQFQTSTRGVSMTAGEIANEVASEIGEDPRVTRPVQPDMPIPNLGIRSGWSVRQPDRGGQWSHQYSDAYITIQAVDPDPQRVLEMMDTLKVRVETALTLAQVDAGVEPVNRFTTSLAPPTTALYQMNGSRPRAFVGLLALGAALTAALAAGLRALLLGRLPRPSVVARTRRWA